MRRSPGLGFCIWLVLAAALALVGCPNDPGGGEDTVATPTFSPQGGEYYGTQTVYLSCATAGAEIYYTTDGSDPTRSDGVLYTSAGVTVSATCQVKARAFKDGMSDSFMGSMDYTILAVPSQVPTPTFAGAESGVYLPGPYTVQVYPTCTLSPVVFVYTTDGTDPVPNATDPEDTPDHGTLWTGGNLTVTRRTTIKVIAVYVGTISGVADSEIAEGFFDVFGNTSTVGSSFAHQALCVDADNHHHVAYRDKPLLSNDRLMYATDAGGTWVSEEVCPPTTYDLGWDWMAIGVASDGDVHLVAHRTSAPAGLRHFVRSHLDSSWSAPITVDSTETTNYVGQYVSMAVYDNDTLHAVYYDATNKDFREADYNASSWGAWPLADAGDVGEYGSAATDGSHVFTSYYDASNKDLRSTSSVADTDDPIDTEGNVGMWSSIAVDGNDKVHISYYDETNGDLKYATNASGAWVTETVDSTGTTGLYTSIAVDADGIPCIVYYYDRPSDSSYDLWYAVKPFGSWLKKEMQVGAPIYAHVAVDGNGYASIAYPGKFLKDGP